MVTLDRKDGQLAAAVAAASVLWLATGIGWGLPNGIATVGGWRVMNGDFPYRDFWTMYAPGSYYVVAGLFGIFGREVAVQSWAAVLVDAASAAALFILLRRLGTPRVVAVLAATVLGIASWTGSPEFDTYTGARLCLLLGWDRTIVYFHTGRLRALSAAGAIFGIAAWFKHDVAAYAAFGVSLSLWATWHLVESRGRWAPPLVAFGRLAMGTAMTLGPVIVLVALVGGADAWHDLIVFPATDFRVVRGEPYPGLLPPVGPVLAWLADPGNLARAAAAVRAPSGWVAGMLPQVGAVVILSLLVWRRTRLAPATAATLVLVISTFPFYWMAAHVQQNTHLFSMAMVVMMAFGAVWAERNPRARMALGAFGAIYALGLTMPAVANFGFMALNRPGSQGLNLTGIRGTRLSPLEYDVFAGLARYVRANVPPDEAIYVGVARHDAIVITNLRLFLLADRPSVARFHELHPGVTDRPDVQREIISELERDQTRCVILWRFGWADEILDRILETRRAEIPVLGATALDEYIAAEYEPVAEFGEYVVMWRRDAPPGR